MIKIIITSTLIFLMWARTLSYNKKFRGNQRVYIIFMKVEQKTNFFSLINQTTNKIF